MTGRSIRGAMREISDAETTGAGPIGILGLEGIFSNSAITLGRGTSFCSWRRGGVTIVCERLSASGGTEMMGWAEYSGSDF
ncbi:MAG: hypothetical protein JWQ87_248 [Candidatus Sulfotelmatobacter sp.]|nr:hypothetical protein [Candidatus Sulfotelmatobacter sp.]